MARKKISLAYITNEATRRATLKKRRRGLMKKVRELSVLCGVAACAVVYAPPDPKPEVWPTTEEAAEILRKFCCMPDVDKARKMMNQESFLLQRQNKLQEQLRRLTHENDELAAANLLRQCLAGRPAATLCREEVFVLLCLIERRSKAVQVRLDQLRAQAERFGSSPEIYLPGGQSPPPLPLPAPLMLPAPSPLQVKDFKDPIGFDSAAIEAMRRCDWLSGGVSGDHAPEVTGGELQIMPYAQGPVAPGGASASGAFVGDDMLAMFIDQVNYNSAWEGLFPQY
uniref:MADS30 n=1 Tax=Apostasia odorata TaxID=280455 RepID=A0A1L1WL24_9ASPA|nr:MADS30 [Apostasia odorata]